jgi:hypothetical protein
VKIHDPEIDYVIDAWEALGTVKSRHTAPEIFEAAAELDPEELAEIPDSLAFEMDRYFELQRKWDEKWDAQYVAAESNGNPEASPLSTRSELPKPGFISPRRESDGQPYTAYEELMGEYTGPLVQQEARRLSPGQEAHNLVHGERASTYGHPREDFRIIAKVWTGLLQDVLQPGVELDEYRVPILMAGLKLSRLVKSPGHHDSRVDTCGYMETMDRLDEPEETL